jgi:intraflagellar transport protein 172
MHPGAQDSRLMIAERCCAALGDTARAAYLRKVIDVAEMAQAEGLPDGTSHYLVRAKMATLDKHFDRAEQILLEQVRAWRGGEEEGGGEGFEQRSRYGE